MVVEVSTCVFVLVTVDADPYREHQQMLVLYRYLIEAPNLPVTVIVSQVVESLVIV